MPPRVRLSTQIVQATSSGSYVCPTCLLKTSSGGTPPTTTRLGKRSRHNSAETGRQLANRNAPTGQSTRSAFVGVKNGLGKRRASNGSLASATAVNAPSTVPPAYRELHQRLLLLQQTASSYVDRSRLQLAAKSLESSMPVIRVAFLGLGAGGSLAARKLARVLLADALGKAEAWEQEILDSASDGRSLLLRYGDADHPTQDSPLVRTMNLPSRYLERNNLEILVTAFNVYATSTLYRDQAALQDAIIVPTLTTSNSSDGRVGFVRYPVHKSVLVAKGVTGAVQFGRLQTVHADETLISAALNVPLRLSTASQAAEEEATGQAVDIDLASHALDLFRYAKANGAQYSHEWQTSRVSALSEWITGPKNANSSELNPTVYNLIASVLSKASESVAQADTAATAVATESTVTEGRRAVLHNAISDWSAEAHRDLQLNLDTAFNEAPPWRRTVWWRLIWRIDDVTVSASDVLRQSWLTEAEQGLAFLTGRILEAGLATVEQLRGPSPQLLAEGRREEMEEYDATKDGTVTVAELMQMPSMLARMQQQTGVNAIFNPPWPQTINLSRQYMLHTLVPDLHRKAQALLATTLSTVGGSSALAAWFYFATYGSGLYESGAIVALGLVYGLRRLQTRWSKDRENFASAVREDARRVLGEVDSHLRKLVNEGGRATIRVEDAKHRSEAGEAVQHCQAALERINSSDS